MVPNEREQDRFNEDGRDEPRAVCAKSCAHGEFLLTQRSADKEKIADIGAGDEEQEDDRCHEGENGGANRRHQVLSHRLEVDVVAGGLVDRKRLPSLCGYAVGSALGALERLLRL